MQGTRCDNCGVWLKGFYDLAKDWVTITITKSKKKTIVIDLCPKCSASIRQKFDKAKK